MNGIGRTVSPPPPLPQAPQPAQTTEVPVAPDYTATLPTELTSQVGSFLDPLDLGYFAQTSKLNLAGAARAVRDRLKPEFRTDSQPFGRFADPKNRLETAVPLDDVGERYLETEQIIQGRLTLELIKNGTLTIEEAHEKWQAVLIQLNCYQNPAGDFIFDEDNVVLDYIVAGYVTPDQVDNLPFLLMDKDIFVLNDYTVRECIKQGYLSFERALNLTEDEWQLLITDDMRLAIGQGKPLNLEAMFAKLTDEPA